MSGPGSPEGFPLVQGATRPVIVIGLDGATWDSIRPAIAGGRLNFISSRLEEGATGTVLSTIPCLTCPAVPALFTGKGPGETGLFEFVKADGSPVSANDIHFPFVWDVAARTEKTCCIANVRLTYPPRKVNGVLIGDDLTFAEGRDFTYPPELRHQIGSFHSEGRHERTREWLKNIEANRVELYADRERLYRQRMAVFEGLTSRSAYDLSVLWVAFTDSVQHFFWHHPEMVRRCYETIDRDLSRLAAMHPRANFLIVSDHGFHAAPRHDFYVNTWLERLGYLKIPRSAIARAVRTAATAVASRLPSDAKLRIRSLLGRREAELQTARQEQAGPALIFASSYGIDPSVDWAATEAYFACYWGIGIRDGLNDRVTDNMAEHIISELRSLRGPDGSDVVQGVWRREEVFKGRHLRALPHVVFLTAPDYAARGLLRSELFSDRMQPETQQGQHQVSREGILLAWGPDIEPGAVTTVDITDIAPTVLHLLGCAVPEDLDGRVRSELFRCGAAAATRPVHYVADSGVPDTAAGPAYSEQEAEQVKARLEDLGYL